MCINTDTYYMSKLLRRLTSLETSAHILLNQSCFSAIAFCTFSTSAASRWLNFSSPALNESTAFWASCMHCPNWLIASGLSINSRRLFLTDSPVIRSVASFSLKRMI